MMKRYFPGEKHLDTGLRGIPVGTCKTSYVDTLEGVHIGLSLCDLVNLEEEDVFTSEQKLPNKKQSKDFRRS